MKKAVIFDIDGTLWDATVPTAEAINRMAESYGLALRVTAADIAPLMGRTAPELGALLLKEVDPALRLKILTEFGPLEAEAVGSGASVLCEGIRETLEELSQSFELYLVSNCQKERIAAFYRATGLERYFRDYESNGRTGLSKGENIRLVMERNALTEAVYVGDTQDDENAARFAGIPMIWAAYGFGSAAAPDAVIRSPRELPAAVKALLG